MVTFEGRAEASAQAVLGPFLKQVEAVLVADGVKTIDVDIRKLNFMSSSCFKDFIIWLSNLEARAPAQRYRMRFLSNPKIRWQKGSLSSLSCFALDLVDIVEA